MRLLIFISFIAFGLNVIAGGKYDISKYDYSYADGNLKPRIVVMTEIAPGETEPDDNESVVRLLSHADLYEIEAIITCSGWNNSGRLYDEDWTKYLHNMIDAYEKDVPNLMKRSDQTAFRTVTEEEGKQEIGY